MKNFKNHNKLQNVFSELTSDRKRRHLAGGKDELGATGGGVGR